MRNIVDGSRRAWLGRTALLAAALALPAVAPAQDAFPTKPVRVIVP
jgi:tripartite-type tricarboxylate transporter receptor subunit TctC